MTRTRTHTTEDVIRDHGIDTVLAIEIVTGISFARKRTAPAGLWGEARDLKVAQRAGQAGTTIGDLGRYYLRTKLAEAEARLDSPTPIPAEEDFQGARD